jgi:hypothetical protein
VIINVDFERLLVGSADITTSHRVWFSDEMRFGLWGQARKRWGLRGVKILQPIQIEFAC